MRIAIVSETWTPSVDGVVTRLRATVRELVRRGHQLLLIVPDGQGHHDHPPGVQVLEIPSVGFSWLSGGRIFGWPFFGRRVRQAIKDFRADLVHCLSPYILGRSGISAAKALDIGLVTSFHQDLAAVARHCGYGFLSRPVWAYLRHQHGRAERNLVTSRAMVELLHEQRIGSVELWPFGVDLERFDPQRRSAEVRRRILGVEPGDDRVVALYVGRLAAEKGLHRLYPLARTPGVRLVMIGDGPMREELERDLAGHDVHFTGWIEGDDLADAYAGADVFTFPSSTETLGFVLIEAMASGLPVVAAASAPTREILGPVGTQLQPADWETAGDLVQHIGRDGRAAASAASRQRALTWDWGAATERLLDIYRSVLGVSQTMVA
jgi:glycosyltransferase involved in cell wall biosynthesis